MGLFYELPTVGYNYKLYYNDISAFDGHDLGHHGHRVGNDIDIRYPGVDNTAGGKFWQESQKKLGQAVFVAAMKLVFKTANTWGMHTNYVYNHTIYQDDLGNDKYADAAHQDHFHLGYR